MIYFKRVEFPRLRQRVIDSRTVKDSICIYLMLPICLKRDQTARRVAFAPHV